VEQFQTMVFFDKIFIDVGIVLAGLTEREAMCFGRFCAMSLEMVLRWHSSEHIFKAEGEGFPGCITRVTLRSATAGIDTETANDFTYENLRSICYKWQARISKVCCDMLATGNYVCIRNTLTLLLKILQQFPMVTIYYKNVEKAVTELRDAEKGKREDISVLATSYLVKLQKRQGVKVVEQKDFCHTTSRMKAATAGATTGGDRGSSTSSPRKRPAPPPVTATSTTDTTGSKESTAAKEPKTPVKSSSSGGRGQGSGGGGTPSTASESRKAEERPKSKDREKKSNQEEVAKKRSRNQ